MTKNNDPQNELNEALANLGSDTSSTGGGEMQRPPEQEANATDIWADSSKASESVEEAFLALIQSNKSDDEIGNEAPPQVTVPSDDIPANNQENPAFFTADQPPLQNNPLQNSMPGGMNANPFAQPQDNPSSQSVFGNEPRVTSEPAFTEFSQNETLEVSEADEKSLTEALSETIAQSLAEIQTGDDPEDDLVAAIQNNDPVMQSVAMQSEPVMQQEQPQQFQPEVQYQDQAPVPPMQPAQQHAPVPPQVPSQPQQINAQTPAIPEFPGANPLDKYPLDVPEQPMQQQPAPVEDLIADMATVTSSEIKIDNNTNNNDVMNQHHAYSNPFEAQKPQPAQVPPQAPVTHLGGATGEASQVAKMSAPVPVELAGPGGNNKSNADPEFQALVQWSNSDVEPSHHGPHDMPNFLSQKREEESKFSIKTVFLSIGISVIVIGMFYVGYQAGSGGQEPERVVDVTPRDEEPVRTSQNTAEATKMFDSNQSSLSGRASAPVKPEATITVFNVANLKGQAGRSIPMNIQLEGRNLGQETMLLLRGIPNEITLTTGIKREGVWSVPISELRKLALNVPSNYKGNFDFEVFAFKDKESGPEHRLASVRIDAMQRRVPTRPVVRNTEPQADTLRRSNNGGTRVSSLDTSKQQAPTGSSSGRQNTISAEQPPAPVEKPVQKVKPPVKSNINPAVEAAMLKRANSLLRNGDVAGARLVFEHVAVMGSKHAAYALARTYERSYLAQLNIIGVIDDIDLAKKWYRKAADLGHAEAAARLRQLGFAR